MITTGTQTVIPGEGAGEDDDIYFSTKEYHYGKIRKYYMYEHPTVGKLIFPLKENRLLNMRG